MYLMCTKCLDKEQCHEILPSTFSSFYKKAKNEVSIEQLLLFTTLSIKNDRRHKNINAVCTRNVEKNKVYLSSH